MATPLVLGVVALAFLAFVRSFCARLGERAADAVWDALTTRLARGWRRARRGWS